MKRTNINPANSECMDVKLDGEKADPPEENTSG
jgi:hypothetical protein